MRKIILFPVFLLLANIMFSQSVFMTVGKDTIYTSDFEKQQKKSLELLGVGQTVDHFIDFSLLRQYALKYNADKSDLYAVELVTQGEKLRDSLYYRPELVESVLQDYYQKMMKERKIQILLFKEDLLPADKKERMEFINSVIKKIGSNTSEFKKAVEEYSFMQDYKNPKYFDIFSFDRFLVDEIYKAQPNKVSGFDIMDKYYYLILVSGERKYLGEVFLDEIVIPDTSAEGKKRAEAIYKEIQDSGNFPEIKKKYMQNFGEIGTGHNAVVQDENLYKNILNAHSAEVFFPIKTDEGYKIYSFLKREDYGNYPKIRKNIYNRMLKSNEIIFLEEDLIRELKENILYKENTEEIRKFHSFLPDTYEKFKNFELKDQLVLVDIGGKVQLTDYELLDMLRKTSEGDYKNIDLIADMVIAEWERKALLEYYRVYYYELERFKESWSNLKDQILIQAAVAIITKQALQDKEGQEEFLKKNSSKYTWKERIEGTYYYCLNSEVEKQVLQMLKNKKTPEYIQNQFKGKTDSQKNELLVVNQGKFTREALNLPLNEKLLKNIYTVDYKSRKLVIDIKSINENDKMSLEEFQSNYISEYVDYKIGEITRELRKDAKIDINKFQEDILIKKYGK